MEQIIEVGVPLLVTFLAALVSILLGVVTSAVKAKNEQLRQDAQHSKYYGLVNVVTGVIDDVVTDIGSEINDEFDRIVLDGKITKAELDIMVDNVKERVGYIVSEQIKLSAIHDLIDDWDDWLEVKIRAYIINKAKNSKNIVLTADY